MYLTLVNTRTANFPSNIGPNMPRTLLVYWKMERAGEFSEDCCYPSYMQYATQLIHRATFDNIPSGFDTLINFTFYFKVFHMKI